MPHIVIPEIALLNQLPDHMRARFEKALSLLHESIEQDPPPTWQEIAEQSAISHYHFLRQFRALFAETPGQYLARIRLQYALDYLFEDATMSVTEVAQLCGFSSSQALAKALKRTLGMSAKALRQFRSSQNIQEFETLVSRLGHPVSSDTQARTSLERQLAQNIKCELRWIDKRYFTGVRQLDPKWDYLDKVYQKYGYVVGLAAVTDLDLPEPELPMLVGSWLDEPAQATAELSAGYYFCCETRVSSDAGYYAVWDELYKRALQQGLELSENGFCIDLMKSIDYNFLSGNAHIELQLPVVQSSLDD